MILIKTTLLLIFIVRNRRNNIKLIHYGSQNYQGSLKTSLNNNTEMHCKYDKILNISYKKKKKICLFSQSELKNDSYYPNHDEQIL